MPDITLEQIEKKMQEELPPYALHRSRISQIMRQMSIRWSKSVKRPLLTEAQKQYRVEFAKRILEDMRILLPWLFTDESMIDTNPMRKGVYRIPGLDYAVPPKIFQDYRGYPAKVMVWGAIGYNFKSKLIRIEGHVNAQKYQQLLNDSGVIEAMNEKYTNWVFQQDGASSHTAKTTIE
jgi:hypothetical protein